MKSFLLLFFLISVALAVPPEEAQPTDRQTIALRALAKTITETGQKIDALAKEKSASEIEDERAELATKISTHTEKLREFQREFISVAANIDLSIDDEEGQPLSLSKEINELLHPIVNELKKATSGPRDMEALRTKIEEATTRSDAAQKVTTALKKHRETAQNKALITTLNQSLEDWSEKEKDATLSLEVLEFQLADLESRNVSIIDSVSQGLQQFFRSRGLHLLLALLAFSLTLYLTRICYRLFKKFSPLHRQKTRSLTTRIIDLSFVTLGSVFALLAAILVLYLANDWVLLTLVLLLSLGIIWISKQAIPRVYEQAKLMLNLGAVREGERVIYEGLPWEVKRIHIYTDLVNPALEGGLRRLPIKDLLELRSRVSDSEGWFPCEKGEWVLLSDDTFGRIVEQTPEYVEIIRLGGARKFIPTASFLEMTPVNLSKNFRISSVFGIDYAHQAISTSKVPQIFEERLHKELVELIGADAIKNISVQFKSAAASSLDYEILADFSGETAHRYTTLHRVIQRVCVDVCNEQKWTIPFTQITVHQATAE